VGPVSGPSQDRATTRKMRRNRDSAVPWRASGDQTVNQSNLLIANTFHDNNFAPLC